MSTLPKAIYRLIVISIKIVTLLQNCLKHQIHIELQKTRDKDQDKQSNPEENK